MVLFSNCPLSNPQLPLAYKCPFVCFQTDFYSVQRYLFLPLQCFYLKDVFTIEWLPISKLLIPTTSEIQFIDVDIDVILTVCQGTWDEKCREPSGPWRTTFAEWKQQWPSVSWWNCSSFFTQWTASHRAFQSALHTELQLWRTEYTWPGWGCPTS